MKHLAPRALWRSGREVRIALHARKQFAIDRSGCGECTVAVEWLTQMDFGPGIEQTTRRAGVEADDRSIGATGQNGNVGYAAEIHDGARRVMTEHRRMEGGSQRCALAAGRHIAAAEIGDGGNAGRFGDHVRIAKLERVRQRARRSMTDGLSV